MHPIPGNPGIEQPGQANAGAMVVGLAAFSGSLRGLKLVPVKWRYLVPPRRIEPVEIASGYPLQGASQTHTVGQPRAKQKSL
jgi:hypothetical protein